VFSLQDRVAVITGGASGIGLATGRRFVAAGATVVLVDRNDARAVAAEINATALRVDVTDGDALGAALDSVATEHERIDVLVNNAGIFMEALIDDTSVHDLRKAFEVNALGVLEGIRRATAYMRPGASIINTASLAGQTGFPGYAAYSASKAAVVALTRVAALEYGPRGIRVNCICPGSVDTPMLAGQPSGDVEAGLIGVAAPLGRIVRPQGARRVDALPRRRRLSDAERPGGADRRRNEFGDESQAHRRGRSEPGLRQFVRGSVHSRSASSKPPRTSIIVFADADPDAAIAGAVENMGQTYIAGRRLLVERAVHDEVAAALDEQASALRVGPGWEDDVQIGPLVSAQQRAHVTGHVAGARDEAPPS
jgi:3alpha(or 20beta)-hydroxysteroid dehydrogenase